MKNIFTIVCLLSALFLTTYTRAQELKCVVTIDKTQIPDLQQYIVDDMKSTILSFMNNRNWTQDEFRPEERINCNIVISLVGIPSQFVYQATAQIQASRPVYGTTYETVLLNYFDKNFNFELNQGQPLNYNENIFNSNLVSLLSFYAQIILAVDYDSFGKLSGGKYIEKALNIANIARDAGDGWNTGDPNNRAALIENMNSQQLIPYRESWYKYHRLALDLYMKDPEAARQIIYEHLATMKEVNRQKPYSILLRSYFLAKRDEMINIFRGADMPMKNKVLTLLRELDPTNTEKYQVILKN
jgi:hypothetical protein